MSALQVSRVKRTRVIADTITCLTLKELEAFCKEAREQNIGGNTKVYHQSGPLLHVHVDMEEDF